MKRKWSIAFLFAFVIVCVIFAAPAFAQDTSARGALGGVVYDSTNASVPDATVTITGPIGNETGKTDNNGEFLFSALIPGLYSVKVQKQGFKVAVVNNAEVLINRMVSIRVVIEPGDISQTVEVVAPTFTVDTTSAAIHEDIPDTFYQNVPLQRGVAGIFYMSPGVVSGLGTGSSNPAISGSSGLENLYVADGVTLNDPTFGGLGVFSRVYGALGTGITLSFIKEVQVNTAAFGPQYGHSTGGLVQMVTKSGGTEMHGVVGGYLQTLSMSDLYQNYDNFNPANLQGKRLHTGTYEGDFELGGYVPGLRKHLFFFGTYDPTDDLTRWAPADLAARNSNYVTLAPFTQYEFTQQYAAKLTFKLNDKNTVESSVFGDPGTTSVAPSTVLLNTESTTTDSHLSLGSRSWATRYDGTFGSSLLVDFAFLWNWNRFSDIPASPNTYQVYDLTQTLGVQNQIGAYVEGGLGFEDNYTSSTKGITFDVSKIVHFGGEHTISVGYNWLFPTYDDVQVNTGPKFALPATNETSGAVSYIDPSAIGKMTDAQVQLQVVPFGPPGSPTCTLCPLMSLPGYGAGGANALEPVYLNQVRGRYDGGVTTSTGKYHAVYINDSWAIGTHVTLQAGVRWEQQRMTGSGAGSSGGRLLLNDNWSPAFGFIVDPKGDRKTKMYAHFQRYTYILPLDFAVRELGGEEDVLSASWSPSYTINGSGQRIVTLNSTGGVVPVFDAAHLLTGTAGAPSNSFPFIYNVLDTEPFSPGTKSEYTDEFVLGVDHQFRGGVSASAKFVDRRMKRVIEDMLGMSVEQYLAGAGSYQYLIGNPSATSRYYSTANEIAFGQGTSVTTADLPSSCFDLNGNSGPFALNIQNTFGQVVGSACFPAINENPWTDSSGNTLPNADFGGQPGVDLNIGKPNGYNNVARIYDAVEFEVNKSFSHNWQMVANYRVSTLHGNYEGAFRNDNGQGDPGISSLFDLLPGKLGLLGQQQGNGTLNTDRKHVVNVFASYVLDRGVLKGMTFGGSLNVQSGVPLTTLVAQEAYTNPGEVPLFGRGDQGFGPVTGTVGAHLEYPFHFGDRYSLKVGLDLLNIADTRRNILIQQWDDLSFGVPNVDFGKPLTFVNPFSARLSAMFEF